MKSKKKLLSKRKTFGMSSIQEFQLTETEGKVLGFEDLTNMRNSIDLHYSPQTRPLMSLRPKKN